MASSVSLLAADEAAGTPSVKIRNAIFLVLILGGLLLAPAAFGQGTSQTLLPPGDLSTKGNQIVDQKGRPVRLACVGWNQVDDKIPLERQTALMAKLGFNCIRLSWVNATKDQDIAGIDRIAVAASKAGLRLILDNHTNEAGHSEQDNWGAQQKNGLWYDLGGSSDGTDGGGNPGTVTDAKFLADWQFVARHYLGNPTVIGYDLRNEPLKWPHMSVWGGGSDRDIASMYTRVGNAVLAIDPTKLIIVEPPNSDCRGVHKVSADIGGVTQAGLLGTRISRRDQRPEGQQRPRLDQSDERRVGLDLQRERGTDLRRRDGFVDGQ